ncbi:hypothetical protein Tco_1242593 [Tanacetum coccineum]
MANDPCEVGLKESDGFVVLLQGARCRGRRHKNSKKGKKEGCSVLLFDLVIQDKTVIKEWEDRMERAATTASSLEAEQDSGNINRTQSMATLNKSFPHGTNSGSGPRCQDTILGGAEAQTRFEAASKQSNDPPLLRVNTLRSGEDNMKLKELMELYTKLSERILDNKNRKSLLVRKRNERYSELKNRKRTV